MECKRCRAGLGAKRIQSKFFRIHQEYKWFVVAVCKPEHREASIFAFCWRSVACMKTTRKGKWPLESHWFSTISQRGNADAMASEIPFMASLPSHASEISLSTKILSRHPCGMGGAGLPIPPTPTKHKRAAQRRFLHNPPLRKFDQQSARPREEWRQFVV